MNLPVFSRKNRSAQHKTSAQDSMESSWSRLSEELLGRFDQLRKNFMQQMPVLDIEEDDREVRVRAEVPGMNEKDIQLSYHDGILTMRGEHREETGKEVEGGVFKQSRYGSLYRELQLGKGLRWDDAKARCRDGVLTVTIPRSAEATTPGKKIDIS